MAKRNDADAEAPETQTLIDFAIQCEYLGKSIITSSYIK